MTPGCLGPHEAKMHEGCWSTDFIPGVTSRTVDLKPTLGQVQRMSFGRDDPPPFYDLAATGASYIGKAKGMKQVLWERGWCVDGMSISDKTVPEKRMDTFLSQSPDFKSEMSALQHTVHARGYILLLSPKFHPEIAGVGIEYSWGLSKLKFRREFNNEIPKDLHNNIVKSMCRDKILTVPRVRHFARRTRDFHRPYLALEGDRPIESKAQIEQMCKVSKAHRNIVDIKPSFIEEQ